MKPVYFHAGWQTFDHDCIEVKTSYIQAQSPLHWSAESNRPHQSQRMRLPPAQVLKSQQHNPQRTQRSMGTGLSRHVTEKKHFNRHVSHCSSANNVIVVYGYIRTPADCILAHATSSGSRVDLMGDCTNSLTIIRPRAVIQCEGVMCMKGSNNVLNMQHGARISVGQNASLVITSTLVMEENANLVLAAGARCAIQFPLYIAKNSSITVLGDFDTLHRATLSGTIELDASVRLCDIGNKGRVYWRDEDMILLVGLIRALTIEKRIDPDVILPHVIPIICKRYDVLMAPKPYTIHPDIFTRVERCPYIPRPK
jgi:hypothetical protein